MADVKFLTIFFDTGNVNYNFVPKFLKTYLTKPVLKATIISTNSKY